MPDETNGEEQAEEAVHYVCQRCGNCCRWPGEVPVGDDEINAIAGFLGIPVDVFTEQYTQLRRNRAGLTLNNVNFNESRGDLVLQVLGSRSEALVEYTQQLSGKGLDAEIGTITQEGDGVRGSIRVKLRGART